MCQTSLESWPSTQTVLCASVESVTYLGDRIEYTVRTAGGRQLTVLGPKHDPYHPGTPVSLCVDTRQATVWSP